MTTPHALLEGLEPKPLWSYFLALSAIPRPSKAEEAAARWVVETARALGCEVEQDAAGNVLARKRAAPGREGARAIALQSHLDMVCEQNEGTGHDFSKEGIRVLRDGDLLRARGTTLGADNGIGVAAALAVLAAKDLAHGPVEALFTVDEETGLTGANALRGGWLRAPVLLNLDSEEEGEITIGCAGGQDTLARRTLTLSDPPAGAQALRLKVSGLRGGHSGIDIAGNRGNALRLLGQALAPVLAAGGVRMASVAGGNKRNAIPREAAAVIHVEPGRVPAVRATVEAAAKLWRTALGAFDPGVSISLEPAPAGPARAMSDEDARAVAGLLLAGPHGVEAMSPDIPGLVQTSTNMGLATTADGAVEIAFLTRSSIDASKDALSERIAATARLAGFAPAHSNRYPGWKPEPGAPVVGLVSKVHEELFGRPAVVKAIHAGLECGIIGEKYPGLEMASIGPSMWDVHTPGEHVSIPSVARFWTLLRAVLERL
jgi:dipeptidase D